jgi:hypothetical protein
MNLIMIKPALFSWWSVFVSKRTCSLFYCYCFLSFQEIFLFHQLLQMFFAIYIFDQVPEQVFHILLIFY